MKLISLILGGVLAQDYDYTFYDGKTDADADADADAYQVSVFAN